MTDLQWSPRALNEFNRHLRTYRGVRSRMGEAQQIKTIAIALQKKHVGGAWIQAWAVRAAIAGKTIDDTFSPDNFVEDGDLPKKGKRHHAESGD